MSARSSTHLVLIPSYNPGPGVLDTVRAARAQWAPVWVVVDGSTDGTAEQLQALAASDDELTVIVLPENRGKGAAVLAGTAASMIAGEPVLSQWFGTREAPVKVLRYALMALCVAGVLGTAWLATRRKPALADDSAQA